jgi:outer membrane murein-binding lipoprotein Lpp
MRSSDGILRQVRRALVAVFLLSGLASVLLVALALHAVPLLGIDLALPSGRQLWLLATSASAAALVLLCIEAARERILQRAGLWLDHTLAQHTLSGGRAAAPVHALKSDAAAIGRVRDALIERTALPALEAPWAVAAMIVLALLHPLLGAIAVLAAALLLSTAILQALPIARLDRQRLRAADRVAGWWRGLSAAPLPPECARQWERVNALHVAAAYTLDRRVVLLRDLARMVRAIALLAVGVAGAWLVSRHDLTLGALVAGVLLLAGALLPFERLLGNLKHVRRAMLDYRRLASAADHQSADPPYDAADAQHPTPPAASQQMPRLHIGGPLALGFGAVAVLVAGGLGAVTLLPLHQPASLSGDAQRAFGAVVAVRHAKGGVAAHLHVMRGAEVKAGDVLLSLDTTTLDRQIAALRSDTEAARKELDTVGREAAALATLTPATLADRARLGALEERIVELHQRADTLLARTTDAELDLAHATIRAPVAGRIVSLGVRAPNDSIEAGAVVAEIGTAAPQDVFARMAEPLVRTVHRLLRSLYPESAA